METDVLGPVSQTTYDDSLTSYQFPTRYLKHFEPLAANVDMLAIIYEPRGKTGRGRMAYVGWAVMRGYPIEDSVNVAKHYSVKFVEPIRSFDRAVPREIGGEPVERWLREKPQGRLRNIATLGRAVRKLSSDEAELILRYGSSDPLWGSLEEEDDGTFPPDTEDSRVRRLVTQIERNVQFRQDVLAAYGRRCAVSGLLADGFDGLIEAAHIRGAGSPHFGPDDVKNGIALTPTLHRLFDRHLFSLEYVGDRLVVVISSRLTTGMVHDSMTGSRLRLDDGQNVRLPAATTSRPGRRFVNYHRRSLLP